MCLSARGALIPFPIQVNRSLLRSLARWLAGVMLLGQLAIAAYACPAWQAGVAAAEHGETSAAAQAAQARSVSNCDDSMGSSDPASPNLCAEHCKTGDQSAQAPSIVVPVAWPVALYESPQPTPLKPGRRLLATSPSALVAGSPPHAIVHCVRRT
jgi:hypothetical protein